MAQNALAENKRYGLTVMVVEDDYRYRTLIVDALKTQSYEVLESGTGRSALDIAMSKKVDVVLLDITLPDIDGFTVCQRLQGFTDVPIIMVTGLGKDEDKVRGLDHGAADYITKPFSVAELLARVRAVLRRSSNSKIVSPSLRFNDLDIDFESQRVTLGSREISLTRMEFRLLWFLAANADRVLVPAVIAENVWNAPDGDIGGVLKTTIARLRLKLGDDPANPKYILTRRGIGYVFGPVDHRRK